MRMPLFSYFTVVGTVLLGVLLWLGSDIEPNSTPIRTSQTVGVPRPFKAGPEPPQEMTNANFAAAHAAPTKPTKVVDAARKEKTTGGEAKSPRWDLLAAFPNNNLSIH
jgi:hypothetical protein